MSPTKRCVFKMLGQSTNLFQKRKKKTGFAPVALQYTV